MSCINTNDPRFKEILAKVGNPLLAQIQFQKELDQAAQAAVSTEFDLADKLSPIQQNFADESKYTDEKGNWKTRKMQPQFKGKSTMELIMSGDRTRTTRSETEIQKLAKSFGLSRISQLTGKVVRMQDNEGNEVYTRITGVFPFTQKYQDATWQKEGWVKGVTDRLVNKYPYAIEFELTSRPSITRKPFNELTIQQQRDFLEGQGYKFNSKDNLFSVDSPVGRLADNLVSLEDALTFAFRDHQRFVENKEVFSDPEDLLEDPSDILKEVDPAPVYSEEVYNHFGQPVTIYLQNGIPTHTSLIQGSSESNVKYAARVKFVIDQYLKSKKPIQTELFDEDDLSRPEPEGEPETNDNPTKTLQGEQIDAYDKIQEWLNREIPVTGNMREDFLNHSFFLSGPGGSGKTYITEIILKGKEPTIAAPTHQAKGVLGRNFKVDKDKLMTVQKLLGLRPAKPGMKDPTEPGEQFFGESEYTIIDRVDKAGEPESKSPPGFFYNNSGIFLIDEASMIGYLGELTTKTVNYYSDEENQYVTKDIMINPDLGKLLELFSRIYYNRTGKYPKILFTGDIAQTPSVNTPNQEISNLLEELMQKDSNYAELTEIRRSANEGAKQLQLALRNEIITALKKPKGQRQVNFEEIFNNAEAYEDEWENWNSINDYREFLATFLDTYGLNMDEFQDPEYTQLINFNKLENRNTVKVLELLNKNLFPDEKAEDIKVGDTIIITNFEQRAFYQNGTNPKGIEILKDTKLFVTAVNREVGPVQFMPTGAKYPVEVRVPLDVVTGNIYHHVEGDPKTPITVRTNLATRELLQEIQERKKEFTSSRERLPFYGANLNRDDMFRLEEALGKYSTGLIVNNYKVQGSGVKNPFVDINNMIYGHAGKKDSLHIAMFIYTGISRTREKLYTFYPNVTPNIKPGTRPICG